MKKILLIVFLLFLASYRIACQSSYYPKPAVVDTVKHVFIQYNIVAGLNRTSGRLVSKSRGGYMGFLHFPTQLDPVVGMSMDLVPLLPLKSIHPVKLSRWSLYNTLLFQRYHFATATSIWDNSWSADHPLFQDLYNLEFFYWRLTSAVKYQSKGKNFVFFTTLGYALDYVFKGVDNTRTFRDFNKNGTYSDRGPRANGLVMLPLQKYELDFMGSIGAKYRRLSLEFRYQIPLKQTETLLGHPASIEYLHLLLAYQLNLYEPK
jgi:hypothetical protein